jgi:hypothetical protein
MGTHAADAYVGCLRWDVLRTIARPLPDDWLSFSDPLFEWERVRELVR